MLPTSRMYIPKESVCSQLENVEVPEMDMLRAAFLATILSESLESNKSDYWKSSTRRR
jgi:hypothetical protein